MLKWEKTDHMYYCSDANYYVGGTMGQNHGLAEFTNWAEFRDYWDLKNIDLDYNHLFRFDIKKKYDSLRDIELEDELSLHLYYIMQRKGNYVPVVIHNLYESDMEEVTQYLKECKEYLSRQWAELGGI